MQRQVQRFLFQISRPVTVLGGVLSYALGVGIARYLGNPIDWGLVILGQIWVITYQLGHHYLIAFFNIPFGSTNQNRIVVSKDDETTQEIRRDLVLWLAFSAFAVVSVLTLVLIRSSLVDVQGIVIMGLLVIGAIGYSVPPFRISSTGYGEVLQSFILVNLIPALAFILQYGELHRLVAMSTFPLTILHLAMTLALQLQNYAANLRKGRSTLMTLMGWERGVYLHNLLILFSFLLYGVAMLFGLPLTVSSPVFFVLPLGLFQIWYLVRIASGAKPNWRVLNITAMMTFGLTAYLLTFSFWIR